MAEEEREYVWDEEIAVPVHLIQYIDEGVRRSLPAGTVCHDISPSGASYWARTAKIDATDADGQETAFFIKVHQNQHGKNMASSEYEGMKALYAVMPELVIEPISWGSYEDEPDTYFFVCRFHEMSDDIPDVSDFPALLAEMHRRGVSKDGTFGFPLTTYGGRNPHYFPPSRTWEECFSGGLENTFNMEERTQGETEEMTQLRQTIMTKVIPRLLRPLETEGRTLTPRLLHGDIWDGNASVDVNTGQPVIFDPTPLYAHNEYEMAPWWAPRHKMTGAYIAEYIKHFPVSEPAEDFESRGLLYSLRFDLHASSLYPGNLRFRKIAMGTMRHLIATVSLGGKEDEEVKGAAVTHVEDGIRSETKA